MTNFTIRFIENEAEVERVAELVVCLQKYQKMKFCPRLPTGQDLLGELIHMDSQGKFRPNRSGTFVAVATDERPESNRVDSQSKIIGYLVYTLAFDILRGRYFYINSFFLEHDYRRHGLGKNFIKFLKQHAELIGIKSFDVPVMNDNHAGHKFYESHGSYSVNEEYTLFGQDLDKIENFLR